MADSSSFSTSNNIKTTTYTHVSDDSLNAQLSQFTTSEKMSRFGYNLNNGLFHFRAALSNSANQLVDIMCLGDSITRGEYASTEYTNSWVGRLRSLMQTQYGGTGEGFINVYEGTLPTGAKPRWTISGSSYSFTSTNGGYGGYYIASASGTTTTAVTCTFNGTNVNVVYAQASDGGTINVTVDGVSKGSFNCQNATANFTNIFSITGLATGAHTLTLTPAGNGKAFIEGIIEGGANTSGVLVHRVGVSGWKCTNWTQQNSYLRWAANPAELVIIALGMNEANGNNTLASVYGQNLGTLVSQFKNNGSDVLLLPYHTPASSWTTHWSDYVLENYKIADQYNCALVDMYQAWNSDYTSAQAVGLFGPATNDYSGSSGSNTAHPGDKGYNYIAQIIKPYITI